MTDRSDYVTFLLIEGLFTGKTKIAKTNASGQALGNYLINSLLAADILLEVDLKILQILFVILLCTTPLSAGQALVLTEIEQIQEKIWHLQRSVAAQKSSTEEQQKQLKLIASEVDDERVDLDKQLSTLIHSISSRQDETTLLEDELQNLSETLATLSNQAMQTNTSMLEQAEQIATLQGSLKTVRGELSSKQTDFEKELAETRRQLSETRAQVDTLGQDVGGRIEQIGVWGAGAALILVIVLAIIIIGRKSRPKEYSPDIKQPPRHEM